MGLLDYMEQSNQNETSVFPAFLMGIVQENSDDKKKGHLKVKIPFMKEGKDIIEDVLMLMPYGGEKHGYYFLPEVGDHVLIAFAGNNQTNAYVIGNIYMPDNEVVNQCYQEKNTVKQISTKGGFLIQFTEEKDKEKLTIHTPKKLMISMEDKDEIITIKDSKNENVISLNGKDGKLTIEAKKELEIKCGKSSLQLKSDGTIKMEGGNEVTLAGKECKIEGKTKSEISAQNVNLKGSMAVSIEGKSKTEIKSSGQLALNGSMIKLN